MHTRLLLLLALPIMLSDVPLGVDDLNHLARIFIRARIAEDPDLARLYEVRSGLIPYLGMDLLLTPLARVMPILLLGRLYILALVWGLVGAVAVVARAFTGRVGLGPAAAGLIAYNGLLAWGLINYVLGMILALLLFAAWHAWRAWPCLLRLALFMAGATALYLTHLLAFVLYGVLVGSYECFGRPYPWRNRLCDWATLVGQVAPAIILWVAVVMRMPQGDLTTGYRFEPKVFAVAWPFLFRGAAGGADSGLLTAMICLAVVVIGVRRGWLRWPRGLAAPALALAVLTIVAPFMLLGVALIDGRFSVAAACLAVAGARLSAHALRLTVALASLTVMHVADVTVLMRHCDRQYAELRAALPLLPRGAELTTVLEDSEPVRACTRLPIYGHMAQLVVIDRSGYAPDFFGQTTSVTVRGGRPTDAVPLPASGFTAAPPGGYVLWINLGHHRPVPAGLVLLRRGSFFDLWAAG